MPIFDGHTIYDTRIPNNIASIDDSVKHMKAATLDLKHQIEMGKINASKFTDIQIKQIMNGSDKIPDLTWHHHQDRGRMQLIRTDLHITTGHIGCMKLWFRE